MNYLYMAYGCALAGLLLSIYAWYVEAQINKNPLYKPVCDLSDMISCSAAIKSRFAYVFGISNAIIGIIFYSIILFLVQQQLYLYVYYASIAATIVSICLAYILYFKVRSLCLVCTSIYCVNILLLFSSYSLVHTGI